MNEKRLLQSAENGDLMTLATLSPAWLEMEKYTFNT